MNTTIKVLVTVGVLAAAVGLVGFRMAPDRSRELARPYCYTGAYSDEVYRSVCVPVTYGWNGVDRVEWTRPEMVRFAPEVGRRGWFSDRLERIRGVRFTRDGRGGDRLRRR